MRCNTANGKRVLVRFDENAVSAYYYDGAAWTLLASNAAGATTLDTGYDVRVVADGKTVEVWRRASSSGGAFVKLIDYDDSVNLYGIDFDSTRVRFQSAPNHNPLYTNVKIFADDLSRTVSYTHANNNEIASMTEVDKGVTAYAFDDWGPSFFSGKERRQRKADAASPNPNARKHSWASTYRFLFAYFFFPPKKK